MKFHFKQNGAALLAAFIWGTAFVAQDIAAQYVAPFTFNALRSVVAVAVLGLFLLARGLVRKMRNLPTRKPPKSLWIGGLVCGSFLFVASNLQQLGIGGSGAGKAGFITALYVVLVPLVGLIFKKKAPFTLWIGVAVAVVGLYFLCISEGFTLTVSDLALLACALCFSFQILSVDHFSQKVDPISLSCVQFAVMALLSLPVALFLEAPAPAALAKAALPVLYVGVFSSGVAYTLQIVAQKGSNPTVISLLLSLEALFGVLGGAVVLKEVLTVREYIGCGLMLLAVALSQIPLPQKKKQTP